MVQIHYFPELSIPPLAHYSPPKTTECVYERAAFACDGNDSIGLLSAAPVKPLAADWSEMLTHPIPLDVFGGAVDIKLSLCVSV
eukprot:404054-Amorphochlora_amoeboformis.AAC.1